MNVLDLFSGCGGFSLGFKMAGFRLVGAIDVSGVCCETYYLNLGIRPVKDDIRNQDPRDFDADVIIGSPPCKSFSFASQRRHRPDPENDLIFEFERFVRAIQPMGFVFENVVGLRVGWRRRLVYKLKKTLEGDGYSVADVVLDAYDFGVPQHRKRLFLIGLREPLFFNPKRRLGGTVRDAFRGVEKVPNHVWTKSRPETKRVMSFIPQGKSLSRVWHLLPNDLKGRYSSFANMHNNIYYRLSWDRPSITICHPRKAMIIHPDENRVISVREAARLQGFPDFFTFTGGLNDQYQQVADAVPPPLARAIAMELRIVRNGICL